MHTLAVDTASKSLAAAVLADEKVLAEILIDAGRNHTETFLAAIDAILSLSALEASDMDLFACTVGPGSFTGLRVGIGTVKGLALALEKPVVGVSSLDALAMNVRRQDIPVCSILDARRGEIYAALYRPLEGDIPRRIGAEALMTPESLTGLIEAETVFVGDGARTYEAYFKETLPGKALFAGPEDNRIRAGAVGVIGLKKFETGDRLTALTVTPHYLRSSYAGGIKFA